jgi:hypothetical protein
MTTTTVPTVTEIPDLKVADRCDSKCSAQAFVRIVFKTGMIDLCGHHYVKHAEAIVLQGGQVLDRRDRINQKSESSA